MVGCWLLTVDPWSLVTSRWEHWCLCYCCGWGGGDGTGGGMHRAQLCTTVSFFDDCFLIFSFQEYCVHVRCMYLCASVCLFLMASATCAMWKVCSVLLCYCCMYFWLLTAVVVVFFTHCSVSWLWAGVLVIRSTHLWLQPIADGTTAVDTILSRVDTVANS